MHCSINFPPFWITAAKFEETLQFSEGPHSSKIYSVSFNFPVGCKIMVDSAVRILSLANQLILSTKQVTLNFLEGESGTMGYLNRVGFFDNLNSAVTVTPGRPAYSAAEIHRGGSLALVEIAAINRDFRDKELPSKLTAVLMKSCGNRSDSEELGGAAWTIFAELIDNIFSHSSTDLDGYAALQVYSGGNRLLFAVSDSGLGIMETLRPALSAENPRLAALSDVDLLVEVFRQGLSRHGGERGCGLRGSASKAMKFKANLDVRLPTTRVKLMPARGEYRPNTAQCFEGLPLLWGTHISFEFTLNT